MNIYKRREEMKNLLPSKTYLETITETEDGQLVVNIPEEILNFYGWKENTNIEWIVKEDGTVILIETKN
jgi:bifunctional DNA-binding transcriptional regulator/antitoxin component of YhaV-PrlF toxin-antitoxin module